MSTIIVATDLSENSKHAVQFATDFAVSIHAKKLILLNVVMVQPVWIGLPVSQKVSEGDMDLPNDSLIKLRQEMVQRTHNSLEIEIIVELGFLNQILRHLSKKEKPFAIFIGRHLAGNLDRLFVGGNALRIATHSHFPVIVVPSLAIMTGFKKIALAIDLERPAEFPFGLLRAWIRLLNPAFDIVYVSRDNPSPNDLPAAINIEKAFGDYHPHFHLIENDSVKDGIMEYVMTNSPDLIVFSAQKYRIFHKSESALFVIEPPVPVMIFSYKLGRDASRARSV